ncbi:hypothetical protein [Amphritea balenae]|uniref:Porin n=1 Tax=Amphritea balenae TaxID=452629 RepID=A0A3P1SX03_9GAMM|nr:hypothetical protein [Amphritea balenae]RRD01777.1 hypothetical protein EHS89_04325 [Amphritea balenae]GGK54103.1 hypothetical protein GCM10007941_00210 [Amphritea balenae]
MNINYLSALFVSGLSLLSLPALSDPHISDLSINGFITQGFFYTDENNIYGQSSDNGSFEFREAGINTSYRFNSRLRGAAQLMSRKAGAVDDGNPKLDYALLDYRFTDSVDNAAGIRLGRLKIPFGFYNETRDVAFTRPSIMLPQSLYFDQARDVELSIDGVIVYSYLEVPGGWLDIDLLYGKPQTDTNVEYTYLSGDAPGKFDDSMGYLGRVIYNADGGRVRLGAMLANYEFSYQPAKPAVFLDFDKGNMKLDLFILSAQYNAEKWTATAEYMLHDLDWRELGGVFAVSPQTTIESYYLQLQYRIDQNWELLLRYDDMRLDKDDPNGTTNAILFAPKPAHTFYSEDITVGVGWKPNPDWSFRAELHNVKGTAWAAEQDNTDPTELRKYWNIFALQATYRF